MDFPVNNRAKVILFFQICGFSADFSVLFVNRAAHTPKKPCLSGFRSIARHTVRPVMRFVSRRPFCKWPSRPIPRVKICKSAFHFCYTNIQIIFLLYKSDLYICKQRNRPQTPINKGFFHVSQIGIYRYTDCLHIQREGKGERNGAVWAQLAQKKAATASVYGMSAATWTSTWNVR